VSLSKGLGAWALTPIGGLVVVTVAAVTATGGFFLTGSAKADFTVAPSPSGQSVSQGQSALFAVTLAPSNGFSSPVQLTASGLPAGATASFSPVQLSKGSGTSTMSVTTSTSTPTGTYRSVTVTGTSGSLAHSATMTLTVTPYVAPSFSVSATPASNTMLPGDTAMYQIAVSGGFSGSVALSSVGTLPSGMAMSFSPAPVTPGHSSTLTVTTKSNTPSGNYTLTIAGNAFGQAQQTTTVGLNLDATGKSFSINGPSFSNVAPGVSVPLDLTISNPNNQPLNVTNVTVTVQSVTKAADADPTLRCTTADYVVTQYGGTYPLALGANAIAVKLSSFDALAAHLPAVSMANSTTADQDGCRGANVVLAFTGTGQGG
jgi:uncharacterized membrane protein